ncbi:MAG TPA: VWA domain-containing protein [Gemmatimonadales bacterium]|jgi:uncharacterized protein with von Willebrand factor type A (vWA) domain|nr:VWA domain-containing protein [Gemmatimonadales bacterium]
MMAADFLAHFTAFCRNLRAMGLPVVLSDAIDGSAALALVDIGDRAEVRRALVIALKIRARDRARFDQLFDVWWSGGPVWGRGDWPPASQRPAPHRVPVRAPAVVRTAVDRPGAVLERAEDGTPGYSAHPLLLRKSFEEWSEDDLSQLEEVLARLAVRLATRRSRRLVPVRGTGRVDLRRSFRNAAATSGELLTLARRARPIERPRLVLLCDTSGSMDPHTRFLLAFVLSLRHVVRSLEVFAFNTTLTRVTPWLSRRGVRAILERMAAEVPDWSGGTRIGECLGGFVRDYLSQLVTSKTVIVILSDGLDRGDPEPLERAMRAIHAAARKVIWLNPLMGDPRYAPTARGMATALPFVDQLVPAHNLESLERIVSSLSA